MKFIVYKTTNLINNKIYIGVHRTNPDINDGYIGCGVNYKDFKKKRLRGFPAAVRKYGYNNFKRETLFIYPDTEEGMKQAYEKEAEIVNLEFVKSSKTYNLIVGGKFTVYETLKKVIAQYTIDGKFLRTWSSITEAEEKLGLSSISQALNNTSKYAGDFQWRYYNGNESDIEAVTKKEKTVYQFDLQGNLVKVWKTAVDASKQFQNSNSSRVLINKVCNKQGNSAYGYYWSFKCKFEYTPPKFTAVAKYNDHGEFLEVYNSINEAAISNNIKNAANIIAAIKGRQKRCGNFRWRYFYGNKANIKPI